MADNKSGRDDQADNADRRQRERALLMELERGDETEPPIESAELDDLETELDQLSFPATGDEVVDAVGDRAIDAPAGRYTVAELVPEIETFDSPDEVAIRIRRPTVASSMTRISEAASTLSNKQLGTSQREAYEKTFRALIAIDAVDDDEAVGEITDWIVERIHGKETLPGSRAVRREAAKIARKSGYEISNNEWLGI